MNNWEDLSFIKRSKNRYKVLMAFSFPEIPSRIARKINLSLNTTSRAIRELEKREFLICKTPNIKIGRIYQITEKGKKILDKLKELEND